VVAVGAAELSRLSAISEYVYVDGDRVTCELVTGHEGSHVALVASAPGGEQWWWSRWDGQLSEVVQMDLCDAELQQGRYADDCFLPEGHPGPHSFDLQPPPSPPGQRHPVRPRPRTP
jgi:hypothetical protein